MPRISVLLNTYNYGTLVSGALESVLGQTRPADEIVVVDDGSTDGTKTAVTAFGPSIRYVYQENSGQAQAILRGIAESRGDILCLLDADDAFHRDKLAVIEECLNRDPHAGAIYNAYNIVNSAGAVIAENQPVDFSPANLRKKALFRRAGGVPTSCISIRSSVAKTIRYPANAFRVCADSYLLQVLPLLTEVLYAGDALTSYVIHGENRFISQDDRTRTRMLAELEGITRNAVREYYGIDLYHSLYEIQSAGVQGNYRRVPREYLRALGYIAANWPGFQIAMKEIAKLHLYLFRAAGQMLRPPRRSDEWDADVPGLPGRSSEPEGNEVP